MKGNAAGPLARTAERRLLPPLVQYYCTPGGYSLPTDWLAPPTCAVSATATPSGQDHSQLPMFACLQETNRYTDAKTRMMITHISWGNEPIVNHTTTPLQHLSSHSWFSQEVYISPPPISCLLSLFDQTREEDWRNSCRDNLPPLHAREKKAIERCYIVQPPVCCALNMNESRSATTNRDTYDVNGWLG